MNGKLENETHYRPTSSEYTTGERHEVAQLLKHSTIEIYPTKTIGDFLPVLKETGHPVEIASRPKNSLEETLNLAYETVALGLPTKLHLPVRKLTSWQEAHTILKARESHGLGLMLIAGDNKEQNGDWGSTLDFLTTTKEKNIHVGDFFVAGYPDGHGFIPQPLLEEAEKKKWAFAQETHASISMTTQICLTADPIISFYKKLKETGKTFPLYLNIPGPMSFIDLTKFVLDMELKDAPSIIGKYSNPFQLAAEAARDYRPERLLLDVIRARVPITGVVISPIKRREETVQWLQTVEEELLYEKQ
jgi:methylenetetrahydrofolate reductase (NADPH)